jgi:DNA-binding GntR family transcriptional regulator
MNNAQDRSDFPNKTIAQQVKQSVRLLILHQKLIPGERIDQNSLAEQLNVSLVPIREALKTLEAEGLVNIVPRRGAFVTEVSPDHLFDLYRARQLIEGEAAYHALEQLVDDDVNQLRELNQKMRQATDDKNINQFMELNREFHLIIYRRVGSKHYLDSIIRLWDRSELYRYRYMFVLKNADNAHQDHEAIIQACEARNQAQVKKLIITHIQHTLDGLHEEVLNQNKQSDT